MKKIINLIILIIIISSKGFTQELEIIISRVIDEEDWRYQNEIEKYKNSVEWAVWSEPIGKPFSTSELEPQGNNQYSVDNLCDGDLNTAWVEGKTDYGIGEKFGFTFNFPSNKEYGGSYLFYGIVNLFNGYCKSQNLWKYNSRVKKLKVYYNNNPVCIVELMDSWHFQYFDIGKFFKYKRFNKYMDAPYEIKEGDRLVFEIIDIYPGLKYKDVAVSEFMAKGAGN